jgi:hypothetical protein
VIPWLLLDELAKVGKCNELREGSKEVCSRTMGHRIDPHLDELLSEVSVPEVLYLIVCPSREMLGNS